MNVYYVDCPNLGIHLGLCHFLSEAQPRVTYFTEKDGLGVMFLSPVLLTKENAPEFLQVVGMWQRVKFVGQIPWSAF